MKRVTALIVSGLIGSILLALPALASTQKLLPISSLELTLGRAIRVLPTGETTTLLNLRGVTSVSEIDRQVNTAYVLGNVASGVSCRLNECRAAFVIQGERLQALVLVDRNQDGNPEKKVTVELGRVNPAGTVRLQPRAKASASLVQVRYNRLEKNEDPTLEDRDFVALTVQFE